MLDLGGSLGRKKLEVTAMLALCWSDLGKRLTMILIN
jgi:hypothetical protein